jgi:hypothetical protein
VPDAARCRPRFVLKSTSRLTAHVS